jgi:hypothetical protein
VLKILKRPGAMLSQGDPILQLDLNESVLAIEKLNQQIELKQKSAGESQTRTRRDPPRSPQQMGDQEPRVQICASADGENPDTLTSRSDLRGETQ